MKTRHRPDRADLAKIAPRHPLIVFLSASAKYMVAGFALAGAAMHPEICANMIVDRGRPDAPDEPPL